MSDTPDNQPGLPSTKRVALTEDEQQIIAEYRQRNREVDVHNAALTTVHFAFSSWCSSMTFGAADETDFVKVLEGLRKARG